MGHRLSKIVTTTGDGGTTALADGTRLSKNDIRIHCLGEVDELNAHIGLALSQLDDETSQQILLQVQHDLFDLGAELCQPDKIVIQAAHVDFLNQQAERLNQSLPALKEFILPGGSPALAFLHVARTVCRRCERQLVELHQQQQVNPLSLTYLNRLSDLLFIMPRHLAHQNGLDEVFWQSEYSRC